MARKPPIPEPRKQTEQRGLRLIVEVMGGDDDVRADGVGAFPSSA